MKKKENPEGEHTTLPPTISGIKDREENYARGISSFYKFLSVKESMELAKASIEKAEKKKTKVENG
jgi:hypothetical protein